ncbi:hypothetical protein FE783_06930 [Paenibacillus mesophilus]|uniref:aspartate/glutamate racemase family protein n=1 Tax=Paenibacillus mesophilus TaxID=2582849 RepID=UPI00110E9EDC|nr:aspartate/glutamate racemase family protein [Paenibacillus mesophilus]TMV51504.1 hypothetical protein FE783_06930 [Paenibacillus mesophilus]
MKRKIGCLHAHYSNIEYIQKALASDELELIHFVDPGLMSRITADPDFDAARARNKVAEQIRWISEAKVDGILVTCTNYITLLEEDRLQLTIPLIKIDEPFFHDVCRNTGRQILLFTNPATVDGTMKRLHEYARRHNNPISDWEPRVIDNTFDLIMQGHKDRYADEVSSYIRNLLLSGNAESVSVAQLSMVESAVAVERELNVQIGNPLKPLAAYMQSKLR